MTGRVSVIVLAGGESRRFGSDKLRAELAGVTVLDHLLGGLPGSWPLICVGPERETRRPVVWAREQPPGGGPLAGIEAGLRCVTSEYVVVVAGDMPWAGPVAEVLLSRLATLLREDPGSVAAVLGADGEGYANPLLAAYRTEDLRRILPRPAANRPARLLAALPHTTVEVAGWGAKDVDRPEDLP